MAYGYSNIGIDIQIDPVPATTREINRLSCKIQGNKEITARL